jgi:hypothetical protein
MAMMRGAILYRRRLRCRRGPHSDASSPVRDVGRCSAIGRWPGRGGVAASDSRRSSGGHYDGKEVQWKGFELSSNSNLSRSSRTASLMIAGGLGDESPRTRMGRPVGGASGGETFADESPKEGDRRRTKPFTATPCARANLEKGGREGELGGVKEWQVEGQACGLSSVLRKTRPYAAAEKHMKGIEARGRNHPRCLAALPFLLFALLRGFYTRFKFRSLDLSDIIFPAPSTTLILNLKMLNKASYRNR